MVTWRVVTGRADRWSSHLRSLHLGPDRRRLELRDVQWDHGLWRPILPRRARLHLFHHPFRLWQLYPLGAMVPRRTWGSWLSREDRGPHVSGRRSLWFPGSRSGEWDTVKVSCEVGESLKKWEEAQGLAETQWRWWGSPVQQL